MVEYIEKGIQYKELKAKKPVLVYLSDEVYRELMNPIQRIESINYLYRLYRFLYSESNTSL